jgi:anti-anti-sigma factor
MDLAITDRVDARDRHVLSLTGSLDLSSRALLRQAAAAALSVPETSALVLNLAAVSFLDSVGIGAVIELAGDAQEAGLAFALQDPSDRVRRVLTMTGLLDAWPIEDTTGQSPAQQQ